jgi:hypothetical protein
VVGSHVGSEDEYVREFGTTTLDCGNPPLLDGGSASDLSGAWIDQVLEVVRKRCVPTGELPPDDETCVELGSETVRVQLTWTGVGKLQRSVYPWREVGEDGTVWQSKYRFASRDADVSGEIFGDLLQVDLTGPGTLQRWSTQDFTKSTE